jgi:hypothetical protein
LKYLAESLQRPWLWVEQVGRVVFGGIFGDVFEDVFEDERVIALHAFFI